MEDLIENKIPFEVTNVVGEDSVELTLSGYVYERWTEDDNAIDAKLVRNALDGVDKPIVIKLNSPGGDVFQGIEIYNYLKNHTSHVTVEVTGLAASAASIISMGADEIVMNTGTTMLIHNASGGVWGNAEDIINYGNMVKTLDKSIIDIYEERTGQSRDTITDWMSVEKTFTASECLEYGFANKVKERTKQADEEIEQSMENEAINDLIAKAVASAFEAKNNTVSEPVKNKTAFEKYIKKGVNK